MLWAFHIHIICMEVNRPGAHDTSKPHAKTASSEEGSINGTFPQISQSCALWEQKQQLVVLYGAGKTGPTLMHEQAFCLFSGRHSQPSIGVECITRMSWEFLTIDDATVSCSSGGGGRLAGGMA